MHDPLDSEHLPLDAPPGTSMPGILAVGSIFGRTRHTIVALTEIHAFPEGCLFHFVAAARRPDPPAPPWGNPEQGIRIFARSAGVEPPSDELLRFSVEYPDGTVVTNPGPVPTGTAIGPVVFTSFEGRGAENLDGSELSYRQPVWLSPLPSVARVRLTAQWPAYGITDAVFDCDCAAIARAARVSASFWTQ
jgi:hypothetical protein